MAESIGASFKKLDGQVKTCLRTLPIDDLSKVDKQTVANIKKVLTTLRLDIRDYEYADTRVEQQKWAKIARHNLHALNSYVALLGLYIGPADFAEMSANIDLVQSNIE